MTTVTVLLSFLALYVAMVAPDMAGECTMAGFYLELGCTPVVSDTNATCPDSFTCPDLHPVKTMCYYRGKAYADLAPLPQSVIRNPCSIACSCSVSAGEGRFECAAVDCVESFNSDIQEQCIYTYELDSCCNTNTVCGKDAIAKLKTCEVDGQTYYEGQTFFPSNTRKMCICTASWDGNVENTTYCRDINCGLEIHYQGSILDKCAPVFAGNDRSCPIAFQCPSPTTKVVRGLNIRANSAQCAFGNETLSIGDEVAVDEKCVKCLCKVPPFVSCTRQNTCDE